MVGHNGEGNALRKWGSLLAGPSDREEFQFHHGISLLSSCQVARPGLDGFPVAVGLLLLEDESQAVEP